MNSEAQRATPLRGFHLFTLFGFEVKLDLSWLLLALLISWSLGAGWFPARYPELSTHTYAWMGVSVAIGVFFSIVFHEFSHSVVARYYGMPIRGITLFIFGGVAEMEDEPPDPNADLRLPLRTIPVKAPVNVSRPIAPYEAVKEVIMRQDRIARTYSLYQRGIGSTNGMTMYIQSAMEAESIDDFLVINSFCFSCCFK